MSYGALKSLITDLQASAFLTGVSVAFGEEMIESQDQPLPSIIVVPRGGSWEGPGYIHAQDPSIENTWATKEAIDVYCWAHSPLPNAQPIDHADAVEDLRQKVLSAFQDQRNQQAVDGSSLAGLYWKPVSGRWETMDDAVDRYGRCYILTLVTEISVPISPPVEATITSVIESDTITDAQTVL